VQRLHAGAARIATHDVVWWKNLSAAERVPGRPARRVEN
jgi:hypothetical protein